MQRFERYESERENGAEVDRKEDAAKGGIGGPRDLSDLELEGEEALFAEGTVEMELPRDIDDMGKGARSESGEVEPVSADGAEADGAAEARSEPPAVSRKVRRRSRRTRPRSKTIAMKRLTREELRLGALLNPPVDIPRPKTRMECQGQARPCPWVACKHHLYLDVNPDTGSIKINFPDLEPWELKETCALDIADRGGITLEEVGEIMNLTRERIRQVEVRGLLKLREASPAPEEIGANAEEMQERHRKRKK